MSASPAHAGSPAARALAFRWPRLYALLADPAAITGAVIVAAIALLALFAPWLSPHGPLDMIDEPLIWPFARSGVPLGTDAEGRDVLSGLIHGSRPTLLVGMLAALISLAVGTVVGALGGYYGRWVDDVLGRLTELFQTVPSFLFVIVLIAIARPSVEIVAASIGGVSWPVIARLVRGEFRRLREADYVLAARGQGYGDLHIIFREILPNAVAPAVVAGSVLAANAILIQSALSYLSFSDPDVVSWGSMVAQGREVMRTEWYLIGLPGLAIVLAALGFNLLSDGINDAFNPHLRGSR